MYFHKAMLYFNPKSLKLIQNNSINTYVKCVGEPLHRAIKKIDFLQKNSEGLSPVMSGDEKEHWTCFPDRCTYTVLLSS